MRIARTYIDDDDERVIKKYKKLCWRGKKSELGYGFHVVPSKKREKKTFIGNCALAGMQARDEICLIIEQSSIDMKAEIIHFFWTEPYTWHASITKSSIIIKLFIISTNRYEISSKNKGNSS